MKILFVINDSIFSTHIYDTYGIKNELERRAVEIELTQEQIDKINLDETNEIIESISVVLEPKNKEQSEVEHVRTKQEICPVCNGIGYYWPYNPYNTVGATMERCYNCRGAGFITVKK